MGTIIAYTETLDPAVLHAAVPGHELLPVSGPTELARAVVAADRLLALIVETPRANNALIRLLRSVKKSFPLLAIGLIGGGPPLEADSAALAGRLIPGGGPEAITAGIRSFLASITASDRRERSRFDWPLIGLLSFDRKRWRKHNLWALSADGAFLEWAGSAPRSGSRAFLQISFQNSRMITRCEVLDPRRSSSRLPAGFAVRFLAVRGDCQALLDKVIRDALLQRLLEPEAEPGLPSLDEEGLSIPDFEPL